MTEPKCVWCGAPTTDTFELKPARKGKHGYTAATVVSVCRQRKATLEAQAARDQEAKKKARGVPGFLG